jgi:cation:H+ antiporter
MFWSDAPLSANLMLFTICAAGVWIAGSKLARYADAIADRKNLGKAFMGLVFLASATELPEIATTFTAAIAGNALLVLSNMFGGITMQTAILAVTDAYVVRGVLTQYPRKAIHALEAALLILLLALLIGVCIAGERSIGLGIGMGTVSLGVAYALSLRLLRAYDKEGDWVPVDLPEGQTDSPDDGNTRPETVMPMNTLVVRSILAALVILACGVVLVRATEAIAEQTGLSHSFMGVTVLAAATSLPELSTTIAAARIGAYTMAISNIFGSNLIMLALLLPADVLYRPGPILAEAGLTTMLSLVFGIIVTGIYVIGLLVRRKPHVLRMGMDSALVLGVYVASLVALYFAG